MKAEMNPWGMNRVQSPDIFWEVGKEVLLG